MYESICFSDLHISPDTVEDVAPVLQQITDDILDSFPDFVVCVGDIGTFDSHNRKSEKFNTSDVKEEKKAVKDVLCKYLFKPIAEFNNRKRQMKKRLYKPTFVFCLGNHDKQEFKWFLGLFQEISKRLKCRVFVYPEDETAYVAGIYFKHTFDKGISGTAHTTCAGLLKDTHCRCVQGHRHVREVAEDSYLNGEKVFAMCLPCATLERPRWAGEGTKKWDTGWLRLSWDFCGYHYEFMEYDYDRIYTVPETC